MNDDKFSLKARRTTRIPLRVPVHLVVQEQGGTRTVDGWTMIVNVHGARIECKRRFALQEEVLLQIPCSGKAQKGKVVWSGSELNNNGNYEFGLELESPANLWGIGFPPSDWNTNRAAAAAELGDSPVVAGPGVVSPGSDPSYTGEQYPTAIPHQDQVAKPAGPPVLASVSPPLENLTPPQVEPPLSMSEGLPPMVNLTAELSEWEAVLNEPPPRESPQNQDVLQEPGGVMGIGMNLPRTDSKAALPEDVALSLRPADLAPVGLELPQPGHGSPVPASPPLGTPGSIMGKAAATDRLSAIFNELVESALQARLLGLMERLAVRVETRIAEVEATTLARMEQQIDGVIATQSERLETHAAGVVMSQQQFLEQDLQKLRQEANADAMRRHQETLQRAETVWTNVRQKIGEELPSIEKHFVEQCRAQTEQLLARRMEELDRRCSERSQEAEQSVSQRMETIVEENTTRFAAQIEARSELLRAQACGQIEQQIDQITHQTRQAFMRHIITELKHRQQLWLQEAQKELNGLAEQKLERTRQSMSIVMKEFGEALIRGTYSEVSVPSEVSSGRNGENGASETEHFAKNG